jgi:hypothetical protein
MCSGKMHMHKHKHGKMGQAKAFWKPTEEVEEPEFRPKLMSKTMFKVKADVD